MDAGEIKSKLSGKSQMMPTLPEGVATPRRSRLAGTSLSLALNQVFMMHGEYTRFRCATRQTNVTSDTRREQNGRR
jgi:hypothetical protein